ncbi:MAG: hypothetical protein ACLFPI_12110, partial [Desulfobacterales bacterium]
KAKAESRKRSAANKSAPATRSGTDCKSRVLVFAGTGGIPWIIEMSGKTKRRGFVFFAETANLPEIIACSLQPTAAG